MVTSVPLVFSMECVMFVNRLKSTGEHLCENECFYLLIEFILSSWWEEDEPEVSEIFQEFDEFFEERKLACVIQTERSFGNCDGIVRVQFPATETSDICDIYYHVKYTDGPTLVEMTWDHRWTLAEAA